MNTQTHFQKQQLCKALQNWLAQQERLQFFVTFNFNSPTSLNGGRTALKRFHAKLDRELYGRSFNHRSVDERTLFFAFPEHIHSNLHYHALLGTPSPLFVEKSRFIWRSLVPEGELHISNSHSNTESKTLSAWDRVGVADYITKELYRSENYLGLVISSEFSSHA